MKHRIDPKVDCVFKALLGAEQNRNLLVHFLNAILAEELAEPITEVEILDPYNEREFLDDKLSIVDVKAHNAAGQFYQIEIQLLNVPDLPARILYGWADLYSAQLRGGDTGTTNSSRPTPSGCWAKLCAPESPTRSTASACAMIRGGAWWITAGSGCWS